MILELYVHSNTFHFVLPQQNDFFFFNLKFKLTYSGKNSHNNDYMLHFNVYHEAMPLLSGFVMFVLNNVNSRITVDVSLV